MSNCNCYIRDTDGLGGFIPRCYGTKEREICQCGGDESKCDFYPEKRKKTETTIAMDAVEYLRQKARMCEYEGSAGKHCENCPFFLILITPNHKSSCDDIDSEYPEKAVQLVCEWAQKHPELPTWNEWLHSVYNYYRGFNKDHTEVSFLNWLNTPITQEEAERFNIPNRKDL